MRKVRGLWDDYNTWVDRLPDVPRAPDVISARIATRHNSQRRRQQRERLAKRDGWKCHWCECELSNDVQMTNGRVPPPRYPTIDHVVERAKGGSNRDDNCVLSCQPCNNDRSNRKGGNKRKRRRGHRDLDPVPSRFSTEAVLKSARQALQPQND